ncbi:MAG: hypothetical protein QW744_02500 [Candidatus Bathyarchaeia archaeon]
MSLTVFLTTALCSKTELPASFYVQFQGELQSEKATFILQFYNGTILTSKNMRLTFSMNQTGKEQYSIHIALDFGSFSNETTTNAVISDGRLIVDSVPSIFVVNPDLLIDGNTIQLYQTAKRTLEGTVVRTGLPPTAIGDYRVTSKMVTAYYKTDSNSMAMPLTLGFDPKTGVLTEAAGQLTDILLDKMGIDFILGGTFELISYSEKLNFDLVSTSQVPLWIILTATASLSGAITALAYKSLRKRKACRNIRTGNVKKLLKVII